MGSLPDDRLFDEPSCEEYWEAEGSGQAFPDPTPEDEAWLAGQNAVAPDPLNLSAWLDRQALRLYRPGDARSCWLAAELGRLADEAERLGCTTHDQFDRARRREEMERDADCFTRGWGEGNLVGRRGW